MRERQHPIHWERRQLLIWPTGATTVRAQSPIFDLRPDEAGSGEQGDYAEPVQPILAPWGGIAGLILITPWASIASGLRVILDMERGEVRPSALSFQSRDITGYLSIDPVSMIEIPPSRFLRLTWRFMSTLASPPPITVELFFRRLGGEWR